MKTSLNIASLILLLTLFNCSSNKEIPSPEIEFDRQIKFYSTVIVWNQSTVINQEFSEGNEKTHYISKGVSYSKKLTNYQLEMSHIAKQLPFGESLRIEEGMFEILGEEGNSIFGTYEGYGEFPQNKPSLELILKVSGGTGYYAQAGGYLEMKTKIYEPHSSALLFELDGFIIRDKESPLSIVSGSNTKSD